ncbi:MAG: class I SAM-dependent methyltransferase [Pseudomonadota bacterium]
MTASRLFKHIAACQGDEPWGSLLDAGTGPQSLAWVSSLETERWTAVTAQPGLVDGAEAFLTRPQRKNDCIVIGNWADPNLLAGQQFDTVLLDYFIGAIDAFAPFGQEALVQRLARSSRANLYIVGLEPYVPLVAEDEAGLFIGDLGRLRDACMLLARNRPYREHPAAWVADQLRGYGLTTLSIERFPLRHRSKFINSQLQICADHVDRLEDQGLVSALNEKVAQMRDKGLELVERYDGLAFGSEYVIHAAPATLL